ncbi:MAG TPA: ribosome maturation factor RimM [Sphingomicrobium sp.]|jgi:16S rRNA processing protein RimM|nr:ribosome maturation factor RimM [Sphingomicrobium sp.]
MAGRIALAAIAGGHGVRGEVRLKLFAESIDSLKRHETLYVAGVPRRLLEIRDAKPLPIARFEDISDRNDAEAFRGELIEVDRADLPPLGEGEYYHADLLGLPCIDRAGTAVGTVVAVENYGAGDLLDIERADGKRTLIPFSPGIADLEDGRIRVDPEFLA